MRQSTPAQSSRTNPKAFTMIEVILVLAISGLIFMGVFIALPNAQLNQRNATRRSDYSRLSTAISNWATDNNGRLPSPSDIKAEWLDEAGQDPDGNAYTVQTCTLGASACDVPVKLSAGVVRVYFASKCDGAGTPASGPSRAFSIYAYMEDGSANGDTYCLDSDA